MTEPDAPRATGQERVRRLVLLRHAKAEPGGRVADVLRPLALPGRKQARLVGPALAGLGLVPDLVLCSDAVRTRQTWDLVRPGFGDTGAAPAVTVTPQVYEAGVDDLLALLGSTDESVHTVLVVGHEPTMSALAATLAGPGSDTSALSRVRVGVPTGTFAVLESGAPWSAWVPAAATLTQVTRPES